MRAKPIGKRVRKRPAGRRAAPSVRGKNASAGRKGGERLSPKQRRQVVQMVVSGGLFVMLVAATWLLPGRTGRLHETLSGAIGRNMDVQAVFSAVGSAFAGEKLSESDLYQAVFGAKAGEAAAGIPAEELQGASAWELLRAHRDAEAGQADPAAEDVSPAEEGGSVLYSPENLPENVCMEQAVLGFEYAAPVSGEISSAFGYRDHPTEGENRFHYGVDLAAEAGADIICFADGEVSAVGESSSYGKYCIVSHANGYRTLYAHCSRIAVSSGAAVRRGEKLAEAGDTGMATGVHLHFELQQDSLYLNPVYYLDRV